ncbi:hypothetical protein Tco_1277455 [Tanacetum coccineum]
MSSSSSSSYRRYNQDVSNKTHCDCKPPHPIPIQTAWTTDNPGRRFRGCPIRDKSKKCGVYGFLDLELPSDYYKGLVYSLHEENKALKRMNRMPVGVMDGTSGVVSNNSFGEKHLKSEFTFIKSKFKIYDRILFGNVAEIMVWKCMILVVFCFYVYLSESQFVARILHVTTEGVLEIMVWKCS